MCGIAGYFTAHDQHPVTESALNKMAATLHHRGPDSEGTWIAEDKSIGLAHTRLAI